jgi:hypothetical protein
MRCAKNTSKSATACEPMTHKLLEKILNAADG